MCVEDTGSGFASENLEQLFDPFYTTKDAGTGLGLPFVQQVMQEHRGEVRARRPAVTGARFELAFPEELILGADANR